MTSLIWCGTCKFATFQGFVIKWIHNPARNPVSCYKIKWESTKYRSKMAVGTYELSIENWTYGSDETYPKRVLQGFKKVPSFLKIAYFAPLNTLRAHTAWSKKTTLLQRFLGHACLQHYTWVAPQAGQPASGQYTEPCWNLLAIKANNLLQAGIGWTKRHQVSWMGI